MTKVIPFSDGMNKAERYKLCLRYRRAVHGLSKLVNRGRVGVGSAFRFGENMSDAREKLKELSNYEHVKFLRLPLIAGAGIHKITERQRIVKTIHQIENEVRLRLLQHG